MQISDIDCHEICLDCHKHVSYNASQFNRHAQKCRGQTPERREYIGSVKLSLRARRDKQLLELLRSEPNAMQNLSSNGVVLDKRLNRSFVAPECEALEIRFQQRSSKRKRLECVQLLMQSSPGETEGNRDSDFNDGRYLDDQHVPVTLSPPATNTSGATLAEPSVSGAARSSIGTDEVNDQIEAQPRAAQLQAPKESYEVMQSKILAYMVAKLGEPNARTQSYLQLLAPRQLQDLHDAVFHDLGLRRLDLEDAFSDLRRCLYSSLTYGAEEDLQASRSSCMTINVDIAGDYEVKVKIGREEGLIFMKKYRIQLHPQYAVEDLRAAVEQAA
jgi:hypothetical protein